LTEWTYFFFVYRIAFYLLATIVHYKIKYLIVDYVDIKINLQKNSIIKF